MTQDEFAELLCAPKSRISDLERGKTKNIKAEEFETLTEKYDVDATWLLTGKGNISQKVNNAAVGINNGNMTINTSNFNHSTEIKEIIELLAYAPPTYLNKIKEKLEDFKQMVEE